MLSSPKVLGVSCREGRGKGLPGLQRDLSLQNPLEEFQGSQLHEHPWDFLLNESG